MRRTSWTHSICDGCWNARPESKSGRAPVPRVDGVKPERCCYCGGMTSAGIYIRQDPAQLECTHDDSEVLS